LQLPWTHVDVATQVSVVASTKQLVPASAAGGTMVQGNTHRPVATTCVASISQKEKGTRQPRFLTGSQMAGAVAGWQSFGGGGVPPKPASAPVMPFGAPPAAVTLPALPSFAEPPVAPIFAPPVEDVPLVSVGSPTSAVPPVSVVPPLSAVPPAPPAESPGGESAKGLVADSLTRQLATTNMRPRVQKAGIRGRLRRLEGSSILLEDAIRRFLGTFSALEVDHWPNAQMNGRHRPMPGN
jgi:hypothetical protein